MDVCVVPSLYQWLEFGYFSDLYRSGEAYLLTIKNRAFYI
jgi:hypothetical protein